MSQTWDPVQYARNARFVADLGLPVVEWLAPRAGERVLDLGCGDGALTEALAAAGCEVVGVDSSPQQIAAARARGIDARVMCGEALSFDAEFDGVFSNAALHWMRDADAVIAGVRRALRPGGRFVGEFGGKGNVATIVAALVAALARRGIDAARLIPWYFPTPEEHRARLESGGFRVDRIELIPRPTTLPGRMADWMETFAQSFLGAVPAGERSALCDEVESTLRPTLFGPDGRWTADYVRLRFSSFRAMS